MYLPLWTSLLVVMYDVIEITSLHLELHKFDVRPIKKTLALFQVESCSLGEGNAQLNIVNTHLKCDCLHIAAS